MTDYTLTIVEPIDAAEQARPHERADAGRTDAALVERFLAGEKAPFLELYDRHNDRLLVYCLKVLGDRDVAGDVTQELWERVLRLRGSGRRIDNPLGYFFKIARNLCLQHRKKKSRGMYQSLSLLPESALPVDRDAPSPLEELILGSLELLSFDHREVLILNMYCGYRFEEIAVMLGKSPEAIWKRASRARRELRELVLAGVREGS